MTNENNENNIKNCDVNADSKSFTRPSNNNNNNNPVYSCNVGSDDFILVEEVGPKRKVSVKETIDAVYPWMESKVRRTLSAKNVIKRFPILNWLPKYSTTDALGDLVAGITVGLTVVPQSLAYASIAGVPPQYGLYGSFFGAFMYIFLGSCKDVPMGPTAITSLLTYQTLYAYTSDGLGPEYGTLLCFLCGVVQFFMGLAGLGIIIDFISGPVSSGFTSAVALLIITSQLKDILGIKGGGTTFPQMMENLLSNVRDIRTGDTTLGVTCILVLLLMRLIADLRVGQEDKDCSYSKKMLNKTLWLIGTSRNAILVLVCGIIGFYCSSKDWFLVIGYIPPGLPTFEPPHFSAENDTVGFLEMVRRMGSGVIVLPLVGVLENIAICKAFSHGKPVDASQELLAIGLCNIGNSFVHGYPGTGSLSRSAVNNSSGVRTPLGGFYTGVLVVLALLFFTPCFMFIPRACLAAVIIAAVVFMVEVRVVKPIYRSKKSDLIPGLATFVACLTLPLEIGILIGIGLNLVSILYHAARPKISIEIHKTRAGIQYLLITPDRCLIFPSVDYVRNLVTKHSIKKGIPVVIDCSHIYGADFTAAKVIEILTQDFSKRGQGLFFYNLKPSIAAIFEAVHPKNFFIYYDKHELDNLLRNNMLNEVCTEKK